MDRLGTWEVPLTSTREHAGNSGRRLNNDPGPEGRLLTFRERKLRDTNRGG
jgi:hypothetical protein